MWIVKFLLFSSLPVLIASELNIQHIPATQTPPSKRFSPVLGYSATTDSLLTYSGYSGIAEQNNLWAFTLSTQTWKPYTPHDSISPSNLY